MTEQPEQDAPPKDPPPRSHVLLWSLVTAFIVLAIGLMWAADYYYSPEMINASKLPDAVGK